MTYLQPLEFIYGEACLPRTVGQALALVSLALGLALAAGQASAVEKGDYQPPDLTQFLLINSEDADGDGDGVKETHIIHYQDVSGDKLFSMTTKGKLWAWSMETPGEKNASGWNYVIRDSNCDGTFDERYRLDEEFHVPDCLK
jgi:hypothetical protein